VSLEKSGDVLGRCGFGEIRTSGKSHRTAHQVGGGSIRSGVAGNPLSSCSGWNRAQLRGSGFQTDWSAIVVKLPYRSSVGRRTRDHRLQFVPYPSDSLSVSAGDAVPHSPAVNGSRSHYPFSIASNSGKIKENYA